MALIVGSQDDYKQQGWKNSSILTRFLFCTKETKVKAQKVAPDFQWPSAFGHLGLACLVCNNL